MACKIATLSKKPYGKVAGGNKKKLPGFAGSFFASQTC
jgi:hypothetical protein